jgi:hypothetical protein
MGEIERENGRRRRGLKNTEGGVWFANGGFWAREGRVGGEGRWGVGGGIFAQTVEDSERVVGTIFGVKKRGIWF